MFFRMKCKAGNGICFVRCFNKNQRKCVSFINSSDPSEMNQVVYILMNALKVNWLCFAIIIILIPTCVVSQELPEKDRNLSLNLGLQSNLVHDEIGSNFIYSGEGFIAGSRLFLSDQKKQQAYHLVFALPRLKNMNENEVTGFYGELQYQHRRHLDASLLKGSLHIGGYWKAKGFIRNYNILHERISGEVLTSLGLSIAWNRFVRDKHLIGLSIQYPVISYVLDYETSAEPPKGLVGPGRLVDYDFDLSYRFNYLAKTSFFIRYHFNYYQIVRDIAPVKYGTNQFLIGLTFRL